MWSSGPLRLRWKVFLLFSSLVVLVGVTCSVLTFRHVEDIYATELNEHLLSHAAQVAIAIDPDRLVAIESDDDPYCLFLRSFLSKAQKASRLSWLAIYRKKRDYFVSVADGHDHLAGMLCTGYPLFDVTPAMLKAWDGVPALSPSEFDIYGSWKSAYVPIRNASGTVVGIVDASQNAVIKARVRSSIVWQTGLMVVIGLILSLLLANRFSSLMTRGLDTLMTGIATIGAGDLTFRFPVLSGDEIGVVARKFNEMVQHLQEKMRLSRFVSESVCNVVRNDLHAQDAEGRERKVTVLFSDIRSFTAITEAHPPQAVVTMLNGFLEAMAGAIERHGGVVDKFIGDSIMAVFYPDEGNDDELRAVQAALDMTEELRLFNRRREQAGLFTIQAGIGINTGIAVAGIIGSSQGRIEYTVIGDPVNTAARLEDLSKNGSHTHIIISGRTCQPISHLFDVQRLGIEKVKGKQSEVEIFEIIGPRKSVL